MVLYPGTKGVLRSRGFSMVELMIGGAFLAGAGLTAMLIFGNHMKAQKNVSHIQKLQTNHASVSKLMTDTRNCNATFNDQYGKTTIEDPAALYTSDTAATFLQDAGNTVRGGPIFQVGGWSDPSNTWRVEDIEMVQLQDTSGATVNNVDNSIARRYRMDVDYVLAGVSMGTAQAGVKETKSVYLTLRFEKTGAGSVFRGCMDARKNSIQNLENDLCETLTPPVPSAGGGQIFTWNKDTQKCQLVTGVKTCGVGYTIEGITSLGVVKCEKISKALNAPLMINSNGCSTTNSNARLVFDSTGKLRISCF